MNGNGHALIATPQSLATERRSQPQQIAELRAQVLDVLGRHSALVQQAAKDSQAIHALLNEHDAALVHHKEALDKTPTINEHLALMARVRALEQRRTFWQRVWERLTRG